jgi:hypothetical protein
MQVETARLRAAEQSWQQDVTAEEIVRLQQDEVSAHSG